MEDRHFPALDQNPMCEGLGLFWGIYDGFSFDHSSGAIVAQCAADNLHIKIKEAVLSGFANPVPGWDMKIGIRDGYLQTDLTVLSLPRNVGKFAGGTTAASVIIREGTIYTSNAGDSRVVACGVGNAIRVSHDHKPSDSDEKERITSAGGCVGESGRLYGMIAVSRGFGAWEWKHGDKPKLISADPYVNVLPCEDIDFLVIASDGLWCVKGDQDVVNSINTQMVNIEVTAKTISLAQCEEITQRLVNRALEAFSPDNITVTVIFFRR